MQTCPDCQAHTHPYLQGINADQPESARIPLHQCLRCGLIFSQLDAIPHAPEELYFEGYYGETAKSRTPNQLVNRLFQTERRLLAFGTRKTGAVLDVGCGDGTFLQNVPTTWTRAGYEPSAAGQRSLQAHGIDFLDLSQPETVLQNPDLKARFDVITLWQAFEHIEKPQPLLAALKHLLRDEGVLFVSVPHIESLQAEVFGPKWFHLDPTRHLFHYNRKTLDRRLAAAGFRRQWMTTFSLEYGVFGWWQSFFNHLPFDFNFGYKILKARKQYPDDFKTKTAKLVYAVAGIPLAFLSLGLMLFESVTGRGGVLQAAYRKHQAG